MLPTNSTNKTVRQFLVICLALVVTGCGKQSGPTTEELIRQQRQRERLESVKPKSLEEKVADVREYLRDRNTVMADQMLRQMLVSHPDHPDVLQLWAECQASRGATLDAVKTLESIETEDAQARAENLWAASKWLAKEHYYDAAQSRLEQMLELPGDPTRVHRKLASILNNQGRRIEAGRHLQELAKIGSIRERELIAMITYSSPFIDETLAKPNFGSDMHPAMLAEARVLHSQRELIAAIELTARLRQAFPESLPIAAFEGRLYGDAQRDDLLRYWLESVPEGIEREPEYWATLGSWLQRRDRHREAVRCLGEAVLRDPTDRFSYDRLRRSLRYLGKKESAERAEARFTKLRESAQLARKFGQQRGTTEEHDRMADLLMDLDRPFESLAWRRIASSSTGDANSQLKDLREQLASIDSGETRPDDDVLCGLDLSTWPLPSGDLFASAGEPRPDGDESGVSADAQIQLRDVAETVGLNFRYDNGDPDPNDQTRLLHQLTGGGIAVVDFDLDGWPDLYLSQGGGDAFDSNGSKPNPMFRNLGGQRFRDVTAHTDAGDTGYGQGVEVADLNQDGFPDLYVANVGANAAFLNNGDGTFKRSPLPGGDDAARWTSSIACGDLDGDHLPEIIEINYVDDPAVLVQRCTPESSSNCNPRRFRPAGDRTLQISPSGTVIPWHGCHQLAETLGYGFAGLITNIDNKPGNELFIANDAGPNFFWIRRAPEASADNRLFESAHVYGCAVGHDGVDRGSMGLAWGDFDRNATLDLHITNFWNEPSDIYLQRPTGLFVSAGQTLGMFTPSRQTVGWGTVATDLDRNGWLDLAVLNGHVREDPQISEPFEMEPQVFRGGPSGFELVASQELGDRYWSDAKSGRMMAMLDWNGDGKTDLVTNHLDEPVALLENQTEGGRSVRVQLVGTVSERDAVGAVVTLQSGEQQWTGWQSGGDGLLCHHEAIVDFGVGGLLKIDRLEVKWPSGMKQQFNDLPTNERFLIVEGQPEVFERTP